MKGYIKMPDIKTLLNSLKDLNSDEAIDKVAQMVKRGEAGLSATQAVALANQVLPMLDKKQQEKVRKLIKKIKS